MDVGPKKLKITDIDKLFLNVIRNITPFYTNSYVKHQN